MTHKHEWKVGDIGESYWGRRFVVCEVHDDGTITQQLEDGYRQRSTAEYCYHITDAFKALRERDQFAIELNGRDDDNPHERH